MLPMPYVLASSGAVYVRSLDHHILYINQDEQNTFIYTMTSPRILLAPEKHIPIGPIRVSDFGHLLLTRVL